MTTSSVITASVILLSGSSLACDGCARAAVAARPTVADGGSASFDAEEKELKRETVWALGNADRTKLIVQSRELPAETLRRYTTAVCSDGPMAVRFEAILDEHPESSGRDTSDNFEKLGGVRFAVAGRGGSADAHCLLVSDAFLSSHPVEKISKVNRECPAALISRLENHSKPWRVKDCGVGGEMASGWVVATVLFKPLRGKQRAGLVLADEKELFLHPLDAGTGDSSSCWRVDDGCEFEASLIQFPFALRYGNRPAPVVDWAGPEGYNVRVLLPRNGALSIIGETYFYAAPN